MAPPPVQRSSQTRDDATIRMDLLMEISRQLGVCLDTEALAAIMDLLEAGVPTETVVAIVTELQRTTRKR
jgi:Mitotic-spindle organizing gamma-tubulin ring associated